eukprot:COSAG01_NODE_15359_length_1346_cov_7.987971_2_plen_123_part_00
MLPALCMHEYHARYIFIVSWFHGETARPHMAHCMMCLGGVCQATSGLRWAGWVERYCNQVGRVVEIDEDVRDDDTPACPARRAMPYAICHMPCRACVTRLRLTEKVCLLELLDLLRARSLSA